jgi:hypothetical protein
MSAFYRKSHQYKDYKPLFTDTGDAIILIRGHSLLSFETFEDLQHTYSWMKIGNSYIKELLCNALQAYTSNIITS